ncbi:MAG TPA: FAD-dependent monooxygenase [Burkholderiales bacterium]|nr:FAD-dependent monooxygenase [Burkholderiales bacterium]
MKHDALIIGAGPAGGAAALMLAQAGWSVAVVEKSGFPRRKVCGEFISATSLPLLHELGVAGSFLEIAGPEVRRVGLFAGETIVTSAMPQPRGPLERWGRALGREHLDMFLLTAASQAGARVWQPWTATELQRAKNGYICKIAAKGTSKELHAPIVIAAHGSWERGTLSAQSINRAHKPSDLLAFKAHFRECDVPSDLMPLLIFPGGYGGMVHSDGGRASLSCCIRRDELRRCRHRQKQHAAEAVLQHIQASCLGVRQALRRASLDGGWLSAGPIRPGIRKRYLNGIFLVGNAAGEAHPLVAEGINMAMQSAWLLCQRLIASQDDIAAERAVAEVGKDYAAEWSTGFAARIRAAAVFAHLAMRPNAAVLLLPVLKRFPGVLTFGAQLSGKARPVVSAPYPRTAL